MRAVPAISATVIGFVVISLSMGPSLRRAHAESRRERQQRIALGKELFERNWRPNDIRSHDGDGLGPVFNERSCVACHAQGGGGGGGPSEKDVLILTPTASQKALADPDKRSELARTIKAQTGFATLGSVVLHRFGTNPDYDGWRSLLLEKQFTSFTLVHSRRNTPPLFGAGLIDQVPDDVLEAAAKRTIPAFPEIHGRVSRLAGGKIGRFGWKGQIDSLYDFVLTACSVELGLEVPGHHQSPDPTATESRTAAEDLNADECNALVSYVANLPKPVEEWPKLERQAEVVIAGSAVFKSIGCAACHTPSVGKVEGIYSDLLLHDMGPESADSAVYYSDSSPIEGPPAIAKSSNQPDEPGPILGARPQEWRTPPLWGLGNSSPYLHDGSATSLDAIIAKHGGEAAMTRARYHGLEPKKRAALRSFLNTLNAPEMSKDGRVRSAVAYRRP